MKIRFQIATMEGALRVRLSPGESVLFGRAPDVTRLPPDLARMNPKPFRVESSHVSANHALVVAHDPLATVIDLQSRNGTSTRYEGDTLVLEVAPREVAPATRPQFASGPAWRERSDYARDLHAEVDRWLRASGVDADVAVVAVATEEPPRGAHRLATGEYLALTLRAGTLDLRIADDLARVTRFVADQNALFEEEEERHPPGYVLRSPGLRAAHHAVCEAARNGRPLLLLGPTGAGKEELARCYHRHAARSDGPFLAVNCGALPENLIENELFGSVPGAWTGAQNRPGRFEEADGGTIFLDEVGELPAAAQAKLLRVLNDRNVVRLGEGRPRPIDVHVVCATNRDLRAMVRDGTFRDDLWYRIAHCTVAIPALRERPEDVEGVLAARGLRVGATAWEALAPDARSLVLQHPWPGNMRELAIFADRLDDARVARVDAARCAALLANTAPVASAPPGPSVPAPPADDWDRFESRVWARWGRTHAGRPETFHELMRFVDEYLKPSFVAWRGGVEGESPVGERAQVNAIARALGVDWNTAEKWLTRFERLRRPPASE